MAAGPALLVKVEVAAVAGVAVVAGPDLDPGARVTRKDGRGIALVVRTIYVIGLIETTIVVVRHWLFAVVGDLAAEELVGRGDARGLFDEVGVDEEEVDVGFAERLLDADAVEAGSGG
jgi:hypothetical protein